MGLSTAGLVFKPTASTPDEPEMIRSAFGEAFHRVPAADIQRSHDIRLPGNLAVESTHGAACIYSSEVAEQILFEGKTPEASLFSGLGNPELLVVFCHYDSSDTFGYAIFENGVRIRSRIHFQGTTNEEGIPMEFEHPWLHAEPFAEEGEEDEEPAYRNTETEEIATESYVTARLLNMVIKEFFGVCPWDEWDYKTTFNHYSRPERP